MLRITTISGGDKQFQILSQRIPSYPSRISAQRAHVPSVSNVFTLAIARAVPLPIALLVRGSDTHSGQVDSQETATRAVVISILAAQHQPIPSWRERGGAGSGGAGGAGGGKEDSTRVLRRAHFILPEIAVVYPISSIAPPSTPALRDEKRAIEERERERRRRVVRSNSLTSSVTSDSASTVTVSTSGSGTEEEWWPLEKVESFYRECCEGCQETPDPGITAALKSASPAHPRTVDLSGAQLTFTSASILSEVLKIEWGLRKLVFRECDLDDLVCRLDSSLVQISVQCPCAVLTPRTAPPKNNTVLMLHTDSQTDFARFAHSTLPCLSQSGQQQASQNNAWKLLGAYVAKAHTLTFLDLSQNPLDKKAVECLAVALPEYVAHPTLSTSTSRTPSILSLNDEEPRRESSYFYQIAEEPRYGLGYGLDDSKLREMEKDREQRKSRAVRTSNLRNISLRHNKISPAGGVALALMIRDYPDVLSSNASPTISHLQHENGTGSNSSSAASSPTSTHPPLPTSPTMAGKLPPPRHPAQTITAAQTTYTPYVPRRRQTADSGLGLGAQAERERELKEQQRDGPSAALLDKVRALDALPRVGALRTLDLRGNDLRTGITYLAQVLKRNRTLKVLNLAENKLDVACLVSLAEALKYNSSRDTRSVQEPLFWTRTRRDPIFAHSIHPEHGPEKAILSSTGLTSPGAIALAEFLPESASLLHLDLTENALDIAGVLALSKGLEANFVMRCLDLNIPPGDEACARMCRDILNVCVRNTEDAEKRAAATREAEGLSTPTSANPDGRGYGKGVWGLIEESALAKGIREGRRGRCLGLKSTNGEPLPTANGVAPTADEPPSTPRIDKGKARAVPEPEEPEKVLSPTKLLMGQGDEDVDSEGPLHVEESEPGSPTTSRSKSWVEEEGEVFRKGTILLGPEEMDGEYAGEDLKKELLEAMVERPPPRPLTDEYGMEIAAPESPPPPEPVSPVVEKSVPRPYVTRRSSSASLMSLISPTSSSFAPLPGAGQIPEQPGSPVVPGSPRPYLSRRTSSSALDSR
ncbi:unnamed protein product [Mycena citricolor]|uniref:RNI-like protein n=1 Tax=Mycena citricolor TaxID=2018698 RepID=A0AAD2HL74_9AGAR|nr:unnamed protein product [Mycena citricolor]